MNTVENVQRKATSFQAYLLLFCGCMSVLAIVVIAPVLPKIQQHFSAVSNVEFLAPLTLTSPGLVVACLALLVGVMADRIGRKNMLFVGLIIYCIFGIAPMFIDSLYTIIGTRIVVGFAEAIIMTCSITLIGDYFHGVQRERYLALNTTFSSFSAVIFIAIGGALGQFGWRVPFALYGISAILAVLVLVSLWEPKRQLSKQEKINSSLEQDELDWNVYRLLFICLVTVFGGIGFMVVQVHIGYLLGAVGTTSSATIGLIAASIQLAVVAGSILFRFILRFNLCTTYRLGLGFLGLGLGYTVVGYANTQEMVTLGGLIAGFGGGILLPAIMCWNMNNLPQSKRALGSGAWMAAFFLGQFLTPIVVVGIAHFVGSITASVHYMGMLVLPLAILLLVWQCIHRTLTKNNIETTN